MPTFAELLSDKSRDVLTDVVVGVDPGAPEGDRSVEMRVHPSRRAGKATQIMHDRLRSILGTEYDRRADLIGSTIKGFNLPAVIVGAYTLRQSRAHCRAETASIQILQANGGNWDLIKSFRYTRGRVESKLEALGKARNHACELTKTSDEYAHLGDPSRNWQSDYPRENGCYQNSCSSCKNKFVGHKHRYLCRKCDTDGG